jgi:hypothetical protein
MVAIKKIHERSVEELSPDPLFDVPASTIDETTGTRSGAQSVSTILLIDTASQTIILTASSTTTLTPSQYSQAATNASYTSILIGGVIGGCLCFFIVVFFVGRIAYLQWKHNPSPPKNAQK